MVYIKIENILRIFCSLPNLFKKKGIEKKPKMPLYVNVYIHIINSKGRIEFDVSILKPLIPPQKSLANLLYMFEIS